MENMNKIEAEKELLKLMKSKGYKKISVNIIKETLNLIDDYAEIVGINRSLIINSILQTGFNHYLDLVKEGVDRALKKGLEDEKDRPQFIKFRKDLKKFRDKNPVLRKKK
jgi:dissimilatory sulfite reductase (desulfoviridin) alpha/beta subunit